MKEIDLFLADWVTPTLRPLGFKKAAHTYRKQYKNGDWAVIGFRSRPIGVFGNLEVAMAFVPEPLFDWFR